MKHGSLFSGIGGFDLASEWMGWENIFHCEINTFCRKVLHHYWPNSITYDDIKKTDFTIHRGNIDVLTGGFPCQPYSHAGKRKGSEDDRHLWPEFYRAIREISPTWVIGENVLGLVNWNEGMVFDEVLACLEDEGYETASVVLPAASINAVHKRERLWIVARKQWKRVVFLGDCTFAEWDTDQDFPICPVCNGEYDTCDCPGPLQDDLLEYKEHKGFLYAKPYPDTSISELQGFKFYGGTEEQRKIKNNRRQSTRSISSTWEEFPTQSPLCGRNDGLPEQLDGIAFSKWQRESLKAYGNSVVPQLVHRLFQTIEEYEIAEINNRNSISN